MASMVTRVYGGFRGVDFRGDDIDLMRSPDSLNMWKDYKAVDGIRTRPGTVRVNSFCCPVFGVFFYHGVQIVHSGKSLYTVQNGEATTLYDGVAERKSISFVYDDIWYFKDGEHYLRYDGETIGDVVGFIPTTSIRRKPSGGGEIKQDVNMLSDHRINTFLADGEATEYSLDAPEIDDDFMPVVTVDDKTVDQSAYTVAYDEGKITFHEAPAAPATDGQDNVTIEYKRAVDGHRSAILGCTGAQLFDNRVFFYGNSEYPNVMWHCSLDDPAYCSDQDKYSEGKDDALIRGVVAGNNALWVFREPSDANTTVYYHNPTIDDEYGKIYPYVHSSITTGCVGTAINFNDDIVFFSERGMEGISGDITTEQVVAHRSTTVDRKMTAEDGYKDMLLTEWNGYLLVFIGSSVYLADSRAMFQLDNHVEYDWYYWNVGQTVLCASVHDGVLYVGTEDGVYTFTDDTAAVDSHWVTPKDTFGQPNKLKTTNKRGCVAEATGDVEVYAKVEDSEFERIGAYRGVTDYFVSRIKRKKFKDIQLKFQSNTRFSLETVTLEAFIGGYVKR